MCVCAYIAAISKLRLHILDQGTGFEQEEHGGCPLLLRDGLKAENKIHYFVPSMIVCDDKQSSSSVTVRTNHMTYILLFVKASDGCLHFAFQSDPHFSDFSGIVRLTKLQL